MPKKPGNKQQKSLNKANKIFYDIVSLQPTKIKETSPIDKLSQEQPSKIDEVSLIDPMLSQDNHGVNNIISTKPLQDVKKARAKQKRLAQQRNENFRQH